MYDIILIGGSAGSIAKIIDIISSLPPNFKTPIVIVTHLPNTFESKIDDVLSSRAGKTIVYPKDMEKIRDYMIYVAPPMYHIQIESDFTFSFALDEHVKFSRPSISVLFEAAARVFKEKTLGIVLSGSSSDGTKGTQTIESYGGTILVQDPLEAEAEIMVESVIHNTESSIVLKTKDIIRHIIESERVDEND